LKKSFEVEYNHQAGKLLSSGFSLDSKQSLKFSKAIIGP